MNIKTIVCAVAASVSFAASSATAGTEFTWNGAAGDSWSDVSKWSAGTGPATRVPGDGEASDDVISLSANTVLTARDADRDRLVKISKVVVHGGAKFVFDNTGTTDETRLVYNGVFQNNVEDKSGEVVKNGTGTVKLAYQASGANRDMLLHAPGGYVINKGRLETPSYPSLAWSNKYFGRMTVNAPGTLVISSNICFQVDGLWGNGEITSLDATRSLNNLIYICGDEDKTTNATFSGTITGTVRINASSGRYDLLGTNPTSGESGVQKDADVGVATIGTHGQAGVFGTGAIKQRGEFSRIRYLGEGETTSRYWTFSSGSGHLVIDAGGGGLDLKRTDGNGITADAASSTVKYSGVKKLELSGDGAKTNRLDLAINQYAQPSEASPSNTIHLVKSGLGRWEIPAGTKFKYRGAVCVENGTLAVGSLAEAGASCSLGYGTALQSPYAGIYTAANDVDWTIRLGDPANAGNTGLLEYMGSALAPVTTRMIAVTGRGGLASSATAAPFDWTGAEAADAQGGTLVLAGETAGRDVNVFRDAIDGAGTLGVEKVGAGAWYLTGTNTDFTGDLAVKEGTLYVQGDQKAVTNAYTWFRFVIRGNYYCHTPTPAATIDHSTQIAELAFYDGEGQRIWAGNSVADGNGLTNFVRGAVKSANSTVYFGDVTTFPPGSYGMVETPFWTQGYYFNFGDRDADNLFDNKYSANGLCFCYRSSTVVSPTNTSNHGCLLVRMPEGVGAVRSFDIASIAGRSSTRSLTDWTMEGSRDGIVWHTLRTFDYDKGDRVPENGCYWYSDYMYCGTSSSTQEAAPQVRKYDPSAAKPKGYPAIAAVGEADAVDILTKVASVSVAKGARLVSEGVNTVRKLRLDATGAGTLKGVTFAEEGVLEIVGAQPGKARTIDFDALEECRRTENLANWTVAFGDTVKPQYGVRLHGNTLTIIPPGLFLIIR